MSYLGEKRRSLKLNKFFAEISEQTKNISHEAKSPLSGILFMYTLQDSALYFSESQKDLIDTFKPYKTKAHLNRDLFKIFSGCSNLFKGLFGLFRTIIVNGGYCFYEMFNGSEENLKNNFEYFSKNLFGSIAQMIRGMIQILTSPLCLLRIPFRYFAFNGIQNQKFQDRKSIQRLYHIVNSDNKISDQDLGNLFRKFVNNKQNDQCLSQAKNELYASIFLESPRSGDQSRRVCVNKGASVIKNTIILEGLRNPSSP